MSLPFNYKNYEEAKKKFDWKERWDLFSGNKTRFNIAHECIDRHPPNDIALRIKKDDRNSKIYTFHELSRLTSKFANYLERAGIGMGDRIAVLLFPSIEFYTCMFGIYKRGATLVPLFPLFGPDAIAYRLEDSKATAIVTTWSVAKLVDPALVEKLGLKFIYADDLINELKKENDYYEPKTATGDLCMIQYSSGTTGFPKPIRYTQGAITVASVVMKFGVGLKPEDNYFCPSSPAWGHGIWYGTIAPLTFGKAVGTLSGKFDAEILLEALEEFKVTNIAGISSHYRLAMDAWKDSYKWKPRIISFTGEAMSKSTIQQIKNNWGLVPYTQYGTTETGPITLDYGGFDDWVVKPGSLGKPMIGGLVVAVIDEEGNEMPPGQIGQMAIKRNDQWVRIGDSAYVDEDGYYWYIGRVDDVIISAGYTIGPIEVEQAVLKHSSVEECAVIGSPDEGRGENVKAFVKLKEGYYASDELMLSIKEFVKDKLSKHEYPRELEFIDELPKTADGKIKRKTLKELEIKRKDLRNSVES